MMSASGICCRGILANSTARARKGLVDSSIGRLFGKVVEEQAGFASAVLLRWWDPAVLVVEVPDSHARASSRLHAGIDRVIVCLGPRSELSRGARNRVARHIEFGNVNFKSQVRIAIHDLLQLSLGGVEVGTEV